MKPKLIVLLLIFFGVKTTAQVNITKVSEFEYSWLYYTTSSYFDRNDKPYIYSCSNELGLITFDISNINNPTPVDTIMPSNFEGLKVTNLVQTGDHLLLCLGGFSGSGQDFGLATVNVSNPSNPQIVDYYKSSTYSEGNAIVRTDGNYAYCGAMEEGIIVLDIQDKSDIKFVSRFLPDLNWPGAVNYSPNARGMALRNDSLYVSYDAGGVRLLDVGDPSNIKELARYVNWNLLGAPANPAYNNIVLIGDYAYQTVDFCGIETLDLTEKDTLKTIEWHNPWNCNGASWFTSHGHTNELVPACNDSLLFVSGGDTEFLVYDISDRNSIKEINKIQKIKDSTAVWGIDVYKNYIVLSYVDNSGLPILQPYYSNFGGIQIYEWSKTGSLGINSDKKLDLKFYPNPTTGVINISGINTKTLAGVYDLNGKLLQQEYITNSINISALSKGSYLLQINVDGRLWNQRIVRK